MCLQIWKLHDIITDIDRHDSYQLKNANIFQLFLYILDCVLLFFFCFLLLDIVSIVAKETKFEQELSYFKLIVSHINFRKKKKIMKCIKLNSVLAMCFTRYLWELPIAMVREFHMSHVVLERIED